MANGRLWALYEDMKAGRISRRRFIAGASALGVAMPVLQFILAATPAGAQQASTQPRPTAGMDGRKRGEGGELKMLQWQAPTTLNAHINQGTKDEMASALISEPLMNFMPDGSLIPNLAKEVPTKENGGLAQDLTSVTYNLLEGVLWSDGKPFTADDVVFTWKWITDPANNSTDYSTYTPIVKAEALSPTQVKFSFGQPTLAWFVPFSGSYTGGVFPKHVLDGASKDQVTAFGQKPIGTGPYVIESFKAGDQAIYTANEKYRDPNKPYFAKINLKGGGDASSAARAVLQTGEWDFAWNMQVEPTVLTEFEKGGKGKIVAAPGGGGEQIFFNFSNPNKEVNGQRGYWKEPHPFLTDKAVRQALSLAADRKTVADEFYLAPIEKPAGNILTGLPLFESKNTSWEFNIAKAKQVLEAAGWKLNGGVREKNGIKLQLSYTTTINSVRQKTQAVIKKDWEEIGVKVQLKQVDAGIFFDSSAGNTQNLSHFFNDVEMYTSQPVIPFPQQYMSSWYSQNGKNIAQKENDWSKSDYSRYNNPEFDKLYESLNTETDLEHAAQTLIKMNDILLDDFAGVMLVNRAAEKAAVATTLRADNVAVGPFETDYWNIANWNRTT